MFKVLLSSPIGEIPSITDLDGLSEYAAVKKEYLGQLASDLPQKAINLGFRVFLTLIFLVVGLIVIKVIRKLAKRALEKANVDKGATTFVDSCIKVILWLILILTIAVNYGFDAASIVAILGSAGIAIGLSLQGALSNFAGGILILLLKPFKVGDYIVEDSKQNEGVVTEINIIYTHLVTVDNKMVVIPNGVLANSSLTNVTREDTRMLNLKVGISYTADLKKAKEVAQKTVDSNTLIMKDKDIKIFVDDLGDSAVILGIRAYVKTNDYWTARWDLLENIKLEFDKNDIEIPFNQVEVHMR